jgi:hypothetical protein
VNSTRATVHEFALVQLGAAVTESEQCPRNSTTTLQQSRMYSTRSYSAHHIPELGPLGPWDCYNHPLRIRCPHQISDWLTHSGHLIQDPLLLATLVCSHADACAMPCPCACTHHAHASDPHVPVKPRESALIPNVTSSPGMMVYTWWC